MPCWLSTITTASIATFIARPMRSITAGLTARTPGNLDDNKKKEIQRPLFTYNTDVSTCFWAALKRECRDADVGQLQMADDKSEHSSTMHKGSCEPPPT